MAEPTPAVDPAEIDTGARALNEEWAPLATRRAIAATVLGAVLPDHDARVRDDERGEFAEEIRNHADRHAPAGHPLNHPRTVLRRHLLLAARIAEGPMTDDDLAPIAAQVVGLARQHTTGEDAADHA